MKGKVNITAVAQKEGMSSRRIYKNLIVVCLGFLFLPNRGLGNLQSSMNAEGDVGVISLAVLEFTTAVSSLFLPKLLIKKFGCKWTMVVGLLMYSPWVVANLKPTLEIHIPSSAVLATFAAPMWSAKCKYINEISSMHSIQTSQTIDVVTTRFFGIFFMIYQNSQVWGNLASFFILKPPQKEPIENSTHFIDVKGVNTNVSYHRDIAEVVCGFGYCEGESNLMQPPTHSQRLILVLTFLFLNLLGALLVAIFLDPTEKKGELDNESIFSKAIATFRHLRKWEQQLLVPASIFCGFEQAFVLGEYTKAYVACSWGIYEVGIVFVFYGLINSVVSFLSGQMAQYVPRYALVTVAAIFNMAACAVLWLWKPSSEEYIYFFVIIGLFAFSDAIWLTQTNSLYAILFRADEEAAFSNYRLWEALGFAMDFVLSPLLCTEYKIYTFLVFMAAGYAGFVIVQTRSVPEITSFTRRTSLIPTQ